MGSEAKQTDTSPAIVIIGAGLTGLIAAHGLKKNGFTKVTIYEREPYLASRPRDWTLVLHWAMPTFLDLLPEHHRKEVPNGYCTPHLDYSHDSTCDMIESLAVYNGETGEHIFSSPMPGARRVSRQKLRRVLSEGLDGPDGCIEWAREVVDIQTGHSIDDPVIITMRDGQVVKADYVLGTDGPVSKVREILFQGQGREEESRLMNSGYLMSSCLVNYGDAAKVENVVATHPVATVLMGMNAVLAVGVLNADDAEDKAQWKTFWHKIWKGSLSDLPVPRRGQETLDYLKRTTAGHPEPFQSLVDWTPEGSTCYIDEMRYWPTVPFDNRKGRVTLAGDAAHPMLVYRGQGFQHAITDVRNFVDALVKIRDLGQDRVEVLTAYDIEMTKRGSEAVMQSVREAEFSMNVENVSKMLMARKGHGRSV